MKMTTGVRTKGGSKPLASQYLPGMTAVWLGVMLASSFSFLPTAVRAQTPVVTTVKDTVYKSDGSLANGSVVISWQSFLTGDSKPVFGGNKTVPLTNGALAVALVPNVGGTPSGTSYRVRYYQSGGVYFEETWVVPDSNPLSSPGAPTVTPQGTTGSSSYCYWISATNASGETLLGANDCISNGNATLDGTNYNEITWAPVSGASGYKVYRTPNQNAPSGSGNYLVGSTASTTINDQSNSLSAATIPSVNTTDARALSDVRVTAAPSPSVQLAASQVNGTAIVSNPTSTQTITAPSGSGIPLQITGRSNNGGNVLEIYDSQATPQLQSYFDSGGALTSFQAPTFSTMTSGSLLFAGTGGVLSQNNANLYWNTTGNRFQAGPRSGNPATDYILGMGKHTVSSVNDAGSFFYTFAGYNEDNSTTPTTAVYGAAASTNTSGAKSQIIGVAGEAYANSTGTGSTSRAVGVAGFAEVDSGSVLDTISLWAINNFGAATNNYGLKVENQTAGTNNWAIKTGLGKVEFGDNVTAKTLNAIRMADQFPGADAGAKIAAAIADLPATGGTVNACGLEGAQSAASTIIINKPVTLLLCGTTLTLQGSPGIDVTSDGVSILGLSPKVSFLIYSGTGSAVKFKKTTAVAIIRGALQNLAIGGTGNDNSGKKAIEIVDGESMAVRDVQVYDWADTGNHNSIGVEIAGRQTFDVSHMSVTADIPFNIIADPNISSITLDHAHFQDIYTIAHSTQPNWKIADGAILTAVTWDGYQAWVNGTYGIYWNSTTDTASSRSIYISNCRWEQSTNSTGYIVHWRNAQGTFDFNLQGCYGGSGANHRGYYIRNTANGSFVGNAYAGTAESFNVGDGTVSGSNTRLDMIGNWFNTGAGATISTTGFAGGAWIGNEGVSNISLARVPPGEQLHLSSTGKIGWDNGSGTVDTNLYRDQANALATDDSLLIKGASTALQLPAKSSAGTVVGQGSVSGDTNNRWQIYADGTLQFGPGNAGLDTALRRGGADLIKVDDAFQVTTRMWSALTTVTFSTTPTFNAALGNSFKMTLTGNVSSSTISNAATGQSITLLLCQDGTGSRTMTWPSNLKLAGGTFALTTTLNKCDSVTAVYDGSNWYESARAANL